MGERMYPVPRAVRAEAAVSDAAGAALLASGHIDERGLRLVGSRPGVGQEWASRVCANADAERRPVLDAVVATLRPGCSYYGLLDPTSEDEVIVAAVCFDPLTGRKSRWWGGAWEDVPEHMEPKGWQYVELTASVLPGMLADLIEYAAVVLRPTVPKAWITRLGPVVAAVAEQESGTYFAVVDQFDTGAVLELFRISQNPTRVESRKDSEWVRDNALLARLRSVDPPPVVAVPADSAEAVLSQVDAADSEATKGSSSASDDEEGPEARGEAAVAASAASWAFSDLQRVRTHVDEALAESMAAIAGYDYRPGLVSAAGTGVPVSTMPNQLKKYWLGGKGAAKIRWGTSGDWTRCFRHLRKYMSPRKAKGACANMHKMATGMWPGDRRNK